MRREPGDDRRRRRGATGALSMRVVLALGASIGLTASVALPMAYQAREARREQAASVVPPTAEVLGTTTVTTDVVPAQLTEGVTWASIETPDSSRPLHGATVSGPGWIRIELDGVVRVDFRIGDGPVVTDTEAPWEPVIGTDRRRRRSRRATTRWSRPSAMPTDRTSRCARRSSPRAGERPPGAGAPWLARRRRTLFAEQVSTSADPVAEASRRRTFAIISHPDAGKTTLTEKLLLYGGALGREAGSVKAKGNRRSATSDWMELEQQRGISITSTVLQFPYRDCVVNLLDTPGHRDFSEDTYRVLTACDAAVMVLDAAKGIEATDPQAVRGVP